MDDPGGDPVLDELIHRADLDGLYPRWQFIRLFSGFRRPKESTNVLNSLMVREFVRTYGTLPLSLVGDDVVAEWLAGGQHRGSVPSLRAMFNEARSAKAGRLRMLICAKRWGNGRRWIISGRCRNWR